MRISLMQYIRRSAHSNDSHLWCLRPIRNVKDLSTFYVIQPQPQYLYQRFYYSGTLRELDVAWDPYNVFVISGFEASVERVWSAPDERTGSSVDLVSWQNWTLCGVNCIKLTCTSVNSMFAILPIYFSTLVGCAPWIGEVYK